MANPTVTSLEVLHERVASISERLRAGKPNVSRNARSFAHWTAALWLFYCAGLWYGARFLPPEARPETSFLFGAVFVVWFGAFFGYVAWHLVKNSVAEGTSSRA